MAYVVLARKYRPMRFADMVGQDHVGRTLSNAIKQDRVHHAYLFSGARGLGKTTTARIFAKGLVCEKGPTPEPCNACGQCVAVNDGHSVDVVEIDGASNNSVENVRGLREQVHYLPQTARRKVYIIDEVHMLTTSAFNALLKTLEEPPPHVNFVLATTEPHKVLPTILSRTSRLDFRRVAPDRLIEHLTGILAREGFGVNESGLAIVARASGGSVRDALTLLDQVLAFAADPTKVGADEVREVLGQAERVAVAELVDAVLAGDVDAAMTRFDAMIGAGQDVAVLAVQILEELRDRALARACADDRALPELAAAEISALRGRAERIDAIAIAQAFDRFGRVVDRLPDSRVPRMLVEMGLLELAAAGPLVPLGDLVERLHALAGERDPTGPASSPGSGAGPGEPRGGGARRPAPRSASPPTRSAVPTDQAPSADPPETPLMRELMAMGNAVLAHEPNAAPVSPRLDEPIRDSAPVTTAAPIATTTTATIAWRELEAFAAWEQLLGRIREVDEYASAVLGEVGLAALGDGLLRVAAPKGSFAHTELTSRPEIRARLEQAVRDHFGVALQLELVEGTPTLPELPSFVLVQRQRREELRARVQTEAREHPAIASLLRAFDGELVATKPLVEP